MTDESVRSSQFTDDRGQDPAGDDQHFVATGIPITVVERLEVVEIKIGQCERGAAFNPCRRFVENGAVAWQASEGIGIQRPFKTAEAQAHALRHFIGR